MHSIPARKSLSRLEQLFMGYGWNHPVCTAEMCNGGTASYQAFKEKKKMSAIQFLTEWSLRSCILIFSTVSPRGTIRWSVAAILACGLPIACLAAASHPQSTKQSATVPASISASPAPIEDAVPAPASNLAPVHVAAAQSATSSEPNLESHASQDTPPTAMPEFEVASIKPTNVNVMHLVGVRVYPGGRVILSGLSLRALIIAAFDVLYGRISGGDEWTGKDAFDIEAKPPEALQSSIKDLRYTIFGIEDPLLREMLQTLLINRFQLKFHRETTTGDVYLLERNGQPLALRPVELATADGSPPSDRQLFGSIGYVDGKWGIFATSMPQLAKFASRIMRVPVLDRTDLSGQFDYRQRQPDLDPKYSGDQSMSFRGCLRELGLKLVPAKAPVETFVIDHAAKPSPN
ncbi:MAG TPA: TIGR03435 family protein [Bryobacteraceae bacterium]|nr:TIGR03435 family protein [Bryobacteraceae bacterium]